MAVEWIHIKLPGWRHLGRYLVWGVGRVGFSFWLFSVTGTKEALKVGIALLSMTERATQQLLSVYNQLPYMGVHGQQVIDTTAIPLPLEPENICTNLMDTLAGKHALIVGDTGSGKSLLAQYLAYQVGGEVTVYDPDASPDEWRGLNVVGRGGDFKAISDAMANDLMELQRRIEVRGQQGDKALAGLDSVSIAEEFPLLKDEISNASEWLIKHARRGRKPKRFIIALSQDDNVVTLGIEGQGGVRKCFRMVRLGKFAVTHAKHIKDKAIEEWLTAGKFRCMVDDQPCQLPDLSSYKMVVPQLQITGGSQTVVTAETTAQQVLEPIETSKKLDREVVRRVVKACTEAGFSDSKIIKEFLGYQGSQFGQGKEILAELRRE
ncbi:ATP-binding protein [Plectonema cf. radiosum LEGE 06105]|uniref:ATP-binding protein n=1 Tax=Plectonema cf. radiosum LEGE 06105 TaxID=945769 RepID=A0A8J7FIN0_9CYAN|nr:ATP-binding protein [Plectonema radiosum]MBE9217013.1 ATP-binding protein [Plectonema cf. radiosum LEGE 06105]